MRNITISIVASVVILTALCPSIAWADDNRTLPEDVKKFIERRDECHHWAGEEPYDKARAKQIDKAMTGLKCDSIERDVAALRRKYTAEAAVQSALANTEE
jgi:hypothetical protein